jgi:hypothetical protein
MYDKTCSQRLDEWAPQATPQPPPQRHCMPTVTPRERIKLPRRAVFFSCLHNPGRRLHSPAGYTMTDSGMQSAHVCTLPLSPADALSDALTTTEHTPCNHSAKNSVPRRLSAIVDQSGAPQATPLRHTRPHYAHIPHCITAYWPTFRIHSIFVFRKSTAITTEMV